jgi:hypothetical protein
VKVRQARAAAEVEMRAITGVNEISDVMRGTAAGSDEPRWKTDPWAYKVPIGETIVMTGWDLRTKGLPQYGVWSQGLWRHNQDAEEFFRVR